VSKRSLAALVLAAAPCASGEIAVLANGQTFKIAGQRLQGETVWLSLKGGGEVGLPRGEVRGVVPDEVVEEVLGGLAPEAASLSDLDRLVRTAAARHGLEPALVRAVIAVESAFEPRAVSPKGAQGLMQLMPATARSLGVGDALDPAENVEGGTRHLGQLVDRYEGDLVRALAAYNAGEGAVARYRGVPPYRETRDYVKKVLARYREGR
jgi:soluble lytic murein transglycosylase-like protein